MTALEEQLDNIIRTYIEEQMKEVFKTKELALSPELLARATKVLSSQVALIFDNIITHGMNKLRDAHLIWLFPTPNAAFNLLARVVQVITTGLELAESIERASEGTNE